MRSMDYLKDLYSNLENQEEDFRNSNLTNLVLDYLKKGSLLDIGCGVGYFLDKARKRGISVRGIEPNKALIELSRRYFGRLNITRGGWEIIYKFDKRFDNITAIDVLEHIEDDESLLSGIRSKLKSQGRLVVVVPAYKFLYGKRDRNLGHVRRYSKKDLIHKLEKFGFRIVKIRYWDAIGVFPYLFYEKILGREIDASIRFKKEQGAIINFMKNALYNWFKFVENRFDFGFGLSIIVVADKVGL